MSGAFEDSRLETPALPGPAEAALRYLASTGARIRSDATELDASARLAATELERPRGVLVVGPEARLVRSVLEPVCPVPMVAWPFDRLPAWVGPLDLVVALDTETDLLGAAPAQSCLESVAEAERRGAGILLAGRDGSSAWRAAGHRSAVRLPVLSGDPMSAAVVVLALLGQIGIGPHVDPEQVARAADLVAEAASPHHDLATNPAKEMACALADADPLLWGGSVLAARSARRCAEALRRASGRAALSADADALMPVITGTPVRDPFADPEIDGLPTRPVLVVMDDGEAGDAEGRARLEAACRQHDVSARRIGLPLGMEEAGPVDRYVTLLLQGRFSAAYLALGLDRLVLDSRAGAR
ncbi:MAG: phosphoheptose isomerase [Acidipropionibacterium jensenii]|uniref:phosphoheptose isomerase n=1 Tax=Acidipropionibacterium jensenii TaxID=1749 RepID=UPI002647CFB8|nr:phosphoheptose isomerase [Acidipropionibacterium jensenii]MDN6442223.1 phosphoheptose isomerase [Acidipropionibacterium jensenii]